MEVFTIIVEYILAFCLILGASTLMLYFGNRLAPETSDREQGKVQYACGEKPFKFSQRLQVSLYKYLVYFLIIDSSLLIIAFAVFDFAFLDPIPLLVYLSALLVSVFLLLDGGEE